MKAFFSSCHEAIDVAVKNKTFGLYYSETTKPSLNIHLHDCCEIFLSLSEGNSILIDDKVYQINKNDLFIINHFEAHKVSPVYKEKFARYSLHVHPSFIHLNSSPECDLSKCFYADNKTDTINLTDSQVDKLVCLFNSLDKDFGFGDELYKKLKVLEILITVNDIYRSYSGVTEKALGDKTLNLAIEYINSRFTQQLSLEDIAKNCFVSVNKLCAVFKKHLSTTVKKYIIGKRITQAKKYLSEGKSVTETAFACGFNDYANFIKIFKSNVGVPPGKYKSN